MANYGVGPAVNELQRHIIGPPHSTNKIDFHDMTVVVAAESCCQQGINSGIILRGRLDNGHRSLAAPGSQAGLILVQQFAGAPASTTMSSGKDLHDTGQIFVADTLEIANAQIPRLLIRLA